MQTNQKFKAGDKVKVLSGCISVKETREMIGGIFEVKEYGGSCSSVWNADKSDYWYFDEKDLELVSEEPILQTSDIQQEVNNALFEVERFLLSKYVETTDSGYYLQAVNLLKIREKLLEVL